ncbi:MAG: DUF2312 domain-containing protein [Candidatus Jidaibacter sp.]|jgi:uncharacterized protein (UPF0335 family)|nr:DUF2312 domain-containing protein [Candidatus Jidaibacter sp.]
MTKVYGISGDLLKQYIEKIERLEMEKAEVAENIRDAFAEAKGAGFEPKIMKQVIKERKMDKNDLDEQETLLVTYKRVLGMLPELDEIS